MVSLLPEILQDKSNLAIEKCSAKSLDISLIPLMIYLVDNVDVRLLPLLAEQFHVQGNEGWNFCKNETEQRDLIKTAIPLHRKKGTPNAVLKALKIINIESEIKEWFEYDGIPYHFRIVLNVISQDFDEQTEIKFLQLIEAYKNKRSILDLIDVYISSKCESTIFNRVLQGEVVTIKPKTEMN